MIIRNLKVIAVLLARLVLTEDNSTPSKGAKEAKSND